MNKSVKKALIKSAEQNIVGGFMPLFGQMTTEKRLQTEKELSGIVRSILKVSKSRKSRK